jgi:hypothetical protein
MNPETLDPALQTADLGFMKHIVAVTKARSPPAVAELFLVDRIRAIVNWYPTHMSILRQIVVFLGLPFVIASYAFAAETRLFEGNRPFCEAITYK